MNSVLTKPEKEGKRKQNILWRLHHWAGLYCGILIGVLSLTGALAVFIPEIDAFIQRQYYNVSSSPAASVQFGKSLAQVTEKYPGYSSLIIDLPDDPGQAAGINFFVKDTVAKKNERYYFFVDTGKDQLIGSRNQLNSLANYLRQMHVRLYESNWGRQLVGIGGIALFVVAVTGLLIYADFMKRQTYPQVRQGRGLRILLADWHKLLGITALLFNLVIGATGAWLGLQPKLMKWFDLEIPNEFKAPEITDKKTDKLTPINWPGAMAAAQQQFPELKIRAIMPSDDGTGTITFTGNITGQVYERNANTLILSKTSLQPVFKYDVRQQPFGHKFYFVQEALHFGDFGGLALKILYALLGLASGFLSISGFIIYLCRTDKKVQRKQKPLKIAFLACVAIVLVLVIAALISLFIGYDQAAFFMAVLINAGLAIWAGYLLIRFLVQKTKSKKLTSA